MSTPREIHSTGRGGAGNIGEDENIYTDGEIVREGPAGETAKVSGRGGVGNSALSAQPEQQGQDVVPETATRPVGEYENYHTGRGGQGNVHMDKYGGHSGPQKDHTGKGSLVDKAKHAVGLDKKGGES